MTRAERIARLDARMRPLLVRLLPARLAVAYYSWARQQGIRLLAESLPERPIEPPLALEQRLWGLRFRAPLLNAAGMFKHGEGYMLAYLQGAGAYLAGTTTALPRMGNVRRGIALPFVPYPRSGAASNWLGLPNPGHRAVAARIAALPRYDRFPIGASVALDPGDHGRDAMERLLEGMWMYRQSGVDFFELNESCPNTDDDHAGFDALAERLRVISERFIHPSGAPVLVKISPDVDQAALVHMVQLAGRLGFAGITLGNTSTQYDQYRSVIAPSERRVYDYFVRTFGGGISGAPLRNRMLTMVAVAHQAASSLQREFHIIAVGGISSAVDLDAARAAGARLAQWYTGYFECFARHGHQLYQHVFNQVEPCSLERDTSS